MNTIIIEVSGGVVQNVFGSQEQSFQVKVIDWDNSESGQPVDVQVQPISLAPLLDGSKL